MGELIRAVVIAFRRDAILHQGLHGGTDVQMGFHYGLAVGVDPSCQNQAGTDGRGDQADDGDRHDDLQQRKARCSLFPDLFHALSLPMGQLKMSVLPVAGGVTPGSS